MMVQDLPKFSGRLERFTLSKFNNIPPEKLDDWKTPSFPLWDSVSFSGAWAVKDQGGVETSKEYKKSPGFCIWPCNQQIFCFFFKQKKWKKPLCPKCLPSRNNSYAPMSAPGGSRFKVLLQFRRHQWLGITWKVWGFSLLAFLAWMYHH